MNPRPLTAALLAAWLPASSLDIAGTVVDKLFKPISMAKVCLESEPSNCIDTDGGGAFRISDAQVGLRPSTAPPAYRLEIRQGTLFLDGPAAKASLEWIGAGGKSAAPARAVELAGGRTAIAMPPGLPGDGVYFVRLKAGGTTQTWKTVILGGTGSAAAGRHGTPPRAMALSKTAVTGSLTVSKAGYRTRTYDPLMETESNVVIQLGSQDDVGFSYSVEFEVKVISIDRTAKRIVTESISTECDESDAIVTDTVRDTSDYAIRGGRMWMWTSGDCFGDAYTGPGTDPVGSWTLSETEADLPSDLREGCQVANPPSGGSLPFDNFTATQTISETKVSLKAGIEFCPGDLYTPAVGNFLLNDPEVSLVRNTCKEAAFVNEYGDTATLAYSRTGDSLHGEFLFPSDTGPDQVCGFTQELFLFDSPPQACPEASPLVPFVVCAISSGFAVLPESEGAMAKSPARPGMQAITRERLRPAPKAPARGILRKAVRSFSPS